MTCYTSVTFHLIFVHNIVYYSHIYVVKFKHIKQLPGIKTKLISLTNQPDVIFSCEVSNGALHPHPSSLGSTHLLPPLHSEIHDERLADSGRFYFVSPYLTSTLEMCTTHVSILSSFFLKICDCVIVGGCSECCSVDSCLHIGSYLNMLLSELLSTTYGQSFIVCDTSIII